MLFILLIILVGLTISHLMLRDRVNNLETILRRYQATETPKSVPTITTPLPPPQQEVSPLPAPQVQPPHLESPTFTPYSVSPANPTPLTPNSAPEEWFIYTWFKEQTLIKIGAIIFFLGIAWFVSYAIDQNWLSPLTRIFLGCVVALIFYTIGHLRAQVETTQYLVLTVLGTSILLGTVVASQFSFTTPVLPPTLALMVMVGSICYTTFVALTTKTEWLAITATVAGLVVPLLIAVTTPSAPLLLTYLLCLSGGFVATAAVAQWRRVPLVLCIGVSLYCMSLYSDLPDMLLWLFICLFVALFTTGVTATIANSDRPYTPDTITLIVTVTFFVISANAMAFSTAIALFVGAGIAASITWWLHTRQASVETLSLYALISLLLLFIATGFLFSGVTLTIIFALEALAIVVGSCYVATKERSVYVAASTFIIPLTSALFDLANSNWNDGIWTIGLLSIIVILTTLGSAIVWLLEHPVLRTLSWIRGIAGTLLIGWCIYVYAASYTVGEALSSLDGTEGLVFFSALLLLTLTIYVGWRIADSKWRGAILIAWIPVVIGGLSLITSTNWEDTLLSSASAISSLLLAILTLVTLFYTYLTREHRLHIHDTWYAYSALLTTIGYSFFWLSAVWRTLYPDTLADVAQYVSYLVVVYAVVHSMLVMRTRYALLLGIISIGSIPLILSLESYDIGGWDTGLLGADAVGLYAVCVLTLTLAISLVSYRGSKTDQPALTHTATSLFWIGGIQLFVLIWMIAHTLASSNTTAVTLALFIYTISGLLAYSYGRTHNHDGFKRAGILLLATVILRLALVDVWTMEVVWRIITFLGIGSLFIVTALLERKHHL